MSKTLKATCACKQIKFTANSIDENQGVATCHCYTCRKLSGHFVAAIYTEAADIIFESGKELLKEYVSSDFAVRRFCANCGSQLFYQENGKSRLSIMVGCIDGNTDFKISKNIFCQEKGDYYALDETHPI